MNQRSAGPRSGNGALHNGRAVAVRHESAVGRLPAGGSPDPDVMLLPLVGALDASNVGDLGRRIRRHVDAARAAGEGLVLDLDGVVVFGAAAAAAVGGALGDADGVAVAVAVSDATIRAVLRARAPTLEVYATVVDAVRAVSARPAGPAPRADARVQDELAALREEVYGLRARSRSRGLIGVAQGMVLARYALPDADSALAVLRESSQHHNVPLRAFASAVVSAPPPAADGPWFPRRRRAPAPPAEFLTARGVRPDERGRALQAAVEAAADGTDADAAALHLVDPARGGALFLEADRHHGPAYRDAYARLAPDASDTAVTVARAHSAGRPTAGTEAAPLFFEQRSAAPLFASVFHRVHAVPLLSSDGRCVGVLSVQHIGTDRRLTRAETGLLVSLAADTHAWHSWYQRTVVLDALERLHTHGTGRG
ncbi:ANTAR domain-containing protein [Actinacidiphila alni]|uniref:ANTAR domain-containing protein n=1 Tax=Actinacidiphila alni TaxID=380248 RepID=A0A1I2JYQ4_9ACTN|nr:ANTAR domain-containing protein [Actinacidiphila alni]SFF59253.1 ANTAR domain-containing protein [Actinacidiphila alni]